jgi:serine/threonine protein phosphatase PrpC
MPPLERPAPTFIFSRRSVASERHTERNEDLILIDRQRGLVAVFDGVGGCPGGDVAARIAARVLRRGWRRFLRESQPALPNTVLQSTDHAQRAREALRALLDEAHRQICIEGPRHPEACGGRPQSTVALAAFSRPPDAAGYCMTYAWVGDSRVYRCRKLNSLESFELLTQDDGLLSALVRHREITARDAIRIDQATYPDMLSATERHYFERRNGLSQALGDPCPPEIHLGQIQIEAGDRVLLCTDGVHDNVTHDEIATVLANARRTTGAARLVETALRQSRRDRDAWMRAKPDDMTAVVVTRAS